MTIPLLQASKFCPEFQSNTNKLGLYFCLFWVFIKHLKKWKGNRRVPFSWQSTSDRNFVSWSLLTNHCKIRKSYITFTSCNIWFREREFSVWAPFFVFKITSLFICFENKRSKLNELQYTRIQHQELLEWVCSCCEISEMLAKLQLKELKNHLNLFCIS